MDIDRVCEQVSESLLRIISLCPRPEFRQKVYGRLGATNGGIFSDRVQQRLKVILGDSKGKKGIPPPPQWHAADDKENSLPGSQIDEYDLFSTDDEFSSEAGEEFSEENENEPTEQDENRPIVGGRPACMLARSGTPPPHLLMNAGVAQPMKSTVCASPPLRTHASTSRRVILGALDTPPPPLAYAGDMDSHRMSQGGVGRRRWSSTSPHRCPVDPDPRGSARPTYEAFPDTPPPPGRYQANEEDENEVNSLCSTPPPRHELLAMKEFSSSSSSSEDDRRRRGRSPLMERARGGERTPFEPVEEEMLYMREALPDEEIDEQLADRLSSLPPTPPPFRSDLSDKDEASSRSSTDSQISTKRMRFDSNKGKSKAGEDMEVNENGKEKQDEEKEASADRWTDEFSDENGHEEQLERTLAVNEDRPDTKGDFSDENERWPIQETTDTRAADEQQNDDHSMRSDFSDDGTRVAVHVKEAKIIMEVQCPTTRNDFSDEDTMQMRQPAASREIAELQNMEMPVRTWQSEFSDEEGERATLSGRACPEEARIPLSVIRSVIDDFSSDDDF